MFKDPDTDPEYNIEPYPSWFWYGRFEGANGWFLTPNAGPLARLLYYFGNMYGRRFGHPPPRISR